MNAETKKQHDEAVASQIAFLTKTAAGRTMLERVDRYATALIASGHYTEVTERGPDVIGEPRDKGCPQDIHLEFFASTYPSIAVLKAISLAGEAQKQLALDLANGEITLQ